MERFAFKTQGIYAFYLDPNKGLDPVRESKSRKIGSILFGEKIFPTYSVLHFFNSKSIFDKTAQDHYQLTFTERFSGELTSLSDRPGFLSKGVEFEIKGNYLSFRDEDLSFKDYGVEFEGEFKHDGNELHLKAIQYDRKEMRIYRFIPRTHSVPIIREL